MLIFAALGFKIFHIIFSISFSCYLKKKKLKIILSNAYERKM